MTLFPLHNLALKAICDSEQVVLKLRTMPASRRKSLNFEGADYKLDVDMARWRKERCKGGVKHRVTFDRVDGKVDETYIILVDRLLGSSDLKMEKDEDDSTYVAFLENLKERGNSYILGVALEHGVLFPLEYEAKGDSPDELNRETFRSCSGSLIQESRSLRVNSDLEAGMKNVGSLKEDALIRKRSRSSIDWMLKSDVKHSDSGKENTQMNALKKNPVSKPSEEVGYLSGQDPRSNSRADTVKDSYGVFISGLKVKGGSVFYEYGDGKQVSYMESDQQKSTDVQNEPSKTVFTAQIPSSRPPVPAPTPSQTASIPRAPNSTCPHNSRSLTAKDPHKVANRLSETASRTQIPTRSLTQSPTPTPRAPASTTICTPMASVGCSSGQHHRSNSRAATTNRSCVVFVCGLEANTESDYEYGNRNQLYYKEGYQQKSTYVQNKPLETAPTMQIPILRAPTLSPTSCQTTSTSAPTRAPTTKSLTAQVHHNVQNKPSETVCKAQILISKPPTRSPIQLAPAPTSTPRTSTSSLFPITRTSIVTDRCDMFAEFSKTLKIKENANRRTRPWFLEKLEHICRKPYEQKEYEDLLEKVNVRKPIVRHKETRGGDYTTTGEMGKSYLDNHPDLDDEINKVRSDPNKVLNLLRGFFFYLQHVPHGVPVPWKHPSCMEIMLRST